MVAAAMLATGCTQDDTLTAAGDGSAVITPDPDKGIVISGSGANGIGATRGYVAPDDAASGPQVDGIARINAIQLLVYKNGRNDNRWPSITEMVIKQGESKLITGDEIKIIGNDRYAQCTEEIVAEETGILYPHTYVMATAFAYSPDDSQLFTLNYPGTNKSTTTVDINNNNGVIKTPELFYGTVRGKGANGDNDVKTVDNEPAGVDFDDWFTQDGFYWGDKNNHTINFTGRIFRIVGQLNLNITEIPGEAVEKIARIIPHAVDERRQVFRVVPVNRERLQAAFRKFAFDEDVGEHLLHLIIARCDARFGKVDVHVFHELGKLVDGTLIAVVKTRLCFREVEIPDGHDRAKRKNGNTQRDDRREPAAESGRAAAILFVLLFRLAGAFFIAFFFFPDYTMRVFVSEDSTAVIVAGVRFLKIVSPFYFLIPVKLVVDGILRGAGSMASFMVSTFSDLLLRVGFAYILAPYFAETGIWYSWPIGWTVASILSFSFYAAGVWKKRIPKEEIQNA